MKQLIAALKRAPKRSAMIAMILSAVIVPAALFAWGPDRPTYTMAHPADHVTFNSITDNPRHGDERNSVQIRNFTDNGQFGENTNLVPGKEYEVYSFYHNNAASNLNDAANNYKGVATGAFMRMQMPATVNAGADARVTGFVGAANATPAQVWDEAYGKNTSAAAVALRYVPGSAKITSNGAVNGTTLPDTLYTTGTPLGYSALDGKLPGCNEYSGYVTYRFKVDQPNFEVQKQVSLAGKNQYAEQVTTTPGSEVEYKIKYKNTGSMSQDHVTIKDSLPAGTSYVAGSTMYSSSKTGSQWTPATSDAVTKGGVDFGSFASEAALYVKFKAKIAANDQLPTCGPNTLVNTAAANTQNGSKSDTATVVVNKTCTPTPPTPVYTCDALSVTKISDTQVKFATAYTVKNATYKSTTYVVKNAAGTEIYRGQDATYTQTTPGTYSVQALVTVTVNGQDKVVTSAGCVKQFTVPTPPAPKEIAVCRLSDKQIITIKETEFDATKHSKDLNDCKETPAPEKIVVCELATKTIVTINESDFDASKHSKDLNACKTVPTPMCEVPGKEHLPANSPDCKETPVTPPVVTPPTPPVTELPQTGMEDALLSLIGAGSLIAAASYYVASRRAING